MGLDEFIVLRVWIAQSFPASLNVVSLKRRGAGGDGAGLGGAAAIRSASVMGGGGAAAAASPATHSLKISLGLVPAGHEKHSDAEREPSLEIGRVPGHWLQVACLVMVFV